MSNVENYILCSRPATEDPAFGIREALIKEIEKQFTIVWLRDLEAKPSLGVKIVAALISGLPVERQMVEDHLDILPNLQIIANNGVGMDHVNVKFYKSRGIKMANTPAILSDACADMALGMIIAAARNILDGVKIAMSSSMPSFNFNYLGTEVTGATLGIVGMGGIGYRIAKRARGFDMNLLYHNRRQRSTEEEKSVGATYCPTLHGLLTQSDFVVIACPQTSETEGLISDAEFDAMKSTAILVNISRGKIINQDALVRALQENKIHRAALDVTDPEPLPRSHPLLTLPNLIITPHIASATEKTRMTMLRLMLDNIQACLEGKPLLTEYTG